MVLCVVTVILLLSCDIIIVLLLLPCDIVSDIVIFMFLYLS